MRGSIAEGEYLGADHTSTDFKNSVGKQIVL